MIEMLTCAIPTMMPHIQRAELEGRANHPHLPQQNLKKNLDGLAYGILFFFLWVCSVIHHPPNPTRITVRVERSTTILSTSPIGSLLPPFVDVGVRSSQIDDGRNGNVKGHIRRAEWRAAGSDWDVDWKGDGCECTVWPSTAIAVATGNRQRKLPGNVAVAIARCRPQL